MRIQRNGACKVLSTAPGAKQTTVAGVTPAEFAGSPDSSDGVSASRVHAHRSQILWLP